MPNANASASAAIVNSTINPAVSATTPMSPHLSTAAVCFYCYAALVVLFRQLVFCRSLQTWLHRKGKVVACMCQWHALLFLGLACGFAFSLAEAAYFSLWLITEQKQKHIAQHLGTSLGSSAWQRVGSIAAMSWVPYFNLWSILAGALSLILTMLHVYWRFILPGMEVARKSSSAKEIPWMPSPRMNWLITLLAMPSVFSLMAVRASCSVWSTTILDEDESGATWSWAELFLFWALYDFARLCDSLLCQALQEATTDALLDAPPGRLPGSAATQPEGRSEHRRLASRGRDAARQGGEATADGVEQSDLASVAQEYGRLITFACFLAIWAFVVTGVLRAIVNILPSSSLPNVNKAISRALTSAFTLFALTAAVNVFFLGNLKLVRERVENFRRKFFGMIFLLLVDHVQQRVLNFLVQGDSGADKLRMVILKLLDFVSQGGSKLRLPELLSHEKSMLHMLHYSLLSFQCLAVVAYDWVVWRDFKVNEKNLGSYTSFTILERAPLPPSEESSESSVVAESASHERIPLSHRGNYSSDAELLALSRDARRGNKMPVVSRGGRQVLLTGRQEADGRY